MNLIVANLRALVTANRVQAIVAFIAMIIAYWQAQIAFDSAQSTKEESDKIGRQLKAVEDIAQQVKRQAVAADRQAAAAEDNLEEARDLVNATRALRDEASRSVEVAKDQLAQTKADNFAIRRARVKVAGTEIGTRAVGYPLFVMALFQNSGQEDPLNMKLGIATASAPPNSTLNIDNLNACADTPVQKRLNWISGRFWKESTFVWSKEQEEEFTKGTKHIYIYGRLCYSDSQSTEYSIEFCGVHFSNGSSQQCAIVDP